MQSDYRGVVAITLYPDRPVKERLCPSQFQLVLRLTLSPQCGVALASMVRGIRMSLMAFKPTCERKLIKQIRAV